MVKKLLGLLFLIFLTVGSAQAQGNGNGQGNTSGSTQAQQSTFQNWPPQVRLWLENGGQGQMPMLLQVRIRLEARPWLQQAFGLSNGQIVQKWLNGEITVTYLPTAPPSPTLTFRVEYGGGMILVVIGDNL